MPPTEPNKRYALYTSVSSTGEEARHLLAAQAALAGRSAAAVGGEIVITYEDQGASSQDESAVALQQLMQDAANPDKPFDAVITATEIVEPLIKCRHELALVGIPLNSIKEQIPDHRVQQLVLALMNSFNEYWRQEHSRRTREGIARSRATKRSK